MAVETSGSTEDGADPDVSSAAPPRSTTDPLSAGCDRALAEAYDVALLDLDGVVYLGSERIASAPDALGRARDRGMRLAFVTNNASRRPEDVAALLSGMGVPAAADDVVTSAQAAAHRLADRLPAGSPVLVVGADALARAVQDRSLAPVRDAASRPAAVVQGFDRAVGWPQLAEAAVALRAGALWVATNTDSTLPSERGPLPGNGSLVAALRVATGLTPEVVGKPEVQLHHDSVSRTGARRPLVVGDRLDTDILGAHNGGADSMVVLTGIATAADLLRAVPDQRPTYLGADLTALLRPHPPVRWSGETVECGDYRAVLTTEGLELAGPAAGGGDLVDALRCLCVLAWQEADRVSADAAPRSSPMQVSAHGDAVHTLARLGLRSG